MVVTILGKRSVDFTDKDGRRIVGFSVYIAHDEKNVEGMSCEKIFISPEMMPKSGITVGSEMVVDYNNRGKVAAIGPVKG